MSLDGLGKIQKLGFSFKYSLIAKESYSSFSNNFLRWGEKKWGCREPVTNEKACLKAIKLKKN